MKLTPLQRLALEQGAYYNYLRNIRQEVIWMFYIHTGVRPGNRKHDTYVNHLLKLGWSVQELSELLIAAFEIDDNR